ncbi:MAG: helix-turn-helix domain-containing protein [Candidatus Thorarchaeota archaeon]|nr:helix-turn-helix domain-containing protein [Candidatus Thorarchaeota archaeon]
MSLELPDSALLVLSFLTKGGPASPREISKKANIPLRTVSFALKHLRGHEICKPVPNLTDMRRPRYIVDADKARAVFLQFGMKMS